MSRKDNLGDRCKLYESAETSRMAMPLIPIVARIDGRAFHTFTKGMDRPYDTILVLCMQNTTKALVKQTGASFAFTQSDEITLTWHQSNTKSQVWFNGRLFKMTSQLAALATLEFYRQIVQHYPQYADRKPTFDCRVWQVSNRAEAANVFLWREWDASKNSVSMLAQSFFSHKKLHGKNGSQMQDMLMAEHGVNWNDYATELKRGTYFQKHKVRRKYHIKEISQLPQMHEARTNPDLIVERSDIRDMLHMAPFKEVSNREAVVFDGAEPKPFEETHE